jgi:hypothetical protein
MSNLSNHSDSIMASVANSLMAGIKSPSATTVKTAKTATPKAPKPVKVAKPATPKVAKPSKTIHPDGTVFFRTDRNKWIAMADGKQEAARDTAEKCVQFLNKKYPALTANILPKE